MLKDLFRNFDGWAWYAFAFGLALTTSTALTSIMASFSLIWFATHLREWRTTVGECREPVFKAMLFFFAVLMLGVPIAFAHGYSPWEMLGKHSKFVVFFILVGLLRTPERRRGAFLGFGFGMILSMALSLVAAGLGIPILHAVPGVELSPFLNHTEHNVFLGLAALGLASLTLRRPVRQPSTLLAWAVIALASFDIMFLVLGRTGQIVYPLLALLLVVFSLSGWKRLGALAGIVAAVGIIAVAGHSAIHHGIEKANQDLTEYHEGQTETSIGLRLAMHNNAWEMIKARPLLGYGTGGYAPAYDAYTTEHGTKTSITTNPHSDYLFYWVENGLPGAAAVVGLYLAMAWTAWRKKGLHGLWLAGLTLAWAVPSLANSVLLDHVSGYTFVVLLATLVAGPLPFSPRREDYAAN